MNRDGKCEQLPSMDLRVLMSENCRTGERCETCRFWNPTTTECRRRAPIVVLRPGDNGDTATNWPHTAATEWCGEWDGERPTLAASTTREPACDDIARQLFLGRVAPHLDAPNPATLLASLLNQLPADVRRVVVRMNGLDGQPRVGLKEIGREFKMSQGQARALVAAGEQRLADAVGRLMTHPAEKSYTPRG